MGTPAFTGHSICFVFSFIVVQSLRNSTVISSEHRRRKTPFPRHKHKSRKTLTGRNNIMLYSVSRRWHKISGDPHAMMEWGLTERESRMEHPPLRWCDSAPNDTDTPQSLQAGQHSSVGHCPPQTQFSPALLRRQACWIAGRWDFVAPESRIAQCLWERGRPGRYRYRFCFTGRGWRVVSPGATPEVSLDGYSFVVYKTSKKSECIELDYAILLKNTDVYPHE